MDTLHDRLAELADDAPTGGAPPAELWARGKRAHLSRASAIAATVLVVGCVGIGMGVRLADGDGKGSDPEPAGTVRIQLPIEYPVGEELPDLGEAPGPLAAVWLVPHPGGGAPDTVGLVAETGMFGRLPIDLPFYLDDPQNPDPYPETDLALSPDGRRIAYPASDGGVARDPAEVIVRDLVSGEEDLNAIEETGLGVGAWIDATHHVGYYSTSGTRDSNAWVWEPGAAPKLVDRYAYIEAYPRPYLGSDLPYKETDDDLQVFINGGGPHSCSPPSLRREDTGQVEVPALCDVLYIGPEFVLGHWNSDRLPGDWDHADDDNGTVVALDIRDITIPPFGSDAPQPDLQFDDPALRRVVVTAGAELASLATDPVAEALRTAGGAS